jgi:hypothetical protein
MYPHTNEREIHEKRLNKLLNKIPQTFKDHYRDRFEQHKDSFRFLIFDQPMYFYVQNTFLDVIFEEAESAYLNYFGTWIKHPDRFRECLEYPVFEYFNDLRDHFVNVAVIAPLREKANQQFKFDRLPSEKKVEAYQQILSKRKGSNRLFVDTNRLNESQLEYFSEEGVEIKNAFHTLRCR